jgi:phytoene desaturase
MKVVVIGSGFGGLAVALRLLAKGHSVKILEAREKVGGRAYQLKENGFTFDMGPSLVTAPPLFDEIFAMFGRKKEEYFSLAALDPFYRIYFEKQKGEFVAMDYTGDPEKMVNEISKFEEGAQEKYEKYFESTRPIFEASYKRYGGKAFLRFGEFVKIFPEMLRLNALKVMSAYVKGYFKSEYVQRALSFHPLYIGTNPNFAPAALGFIPWLEREQGVWFAKGGMYEIVKAFAKLFVENGGEIFCNAEVTKIVTENNPNNKKITVKGVVTKEREYEADVLVSNADVLRTYELVDDKRLENKKNKLRKKAYSMSLFMLYFGLSKQYHEKLAHHTLILGKEYEKLLGEIFEKKVAPTSLSMYLHIPTITDAEMAPPGCESMYILVPVPNSSGTFKWSDEKETHLRNWVVDYLENEFGLEGFREAIVYEKHMTPVNFERDLQSTYGAAFATQLVLRQSVYFREHNRSQEIENLFFVGAGTHPGPGVPGVLLSAKATAELIER